MELGFSPIVTSSMVMQLLAGAKIIDCDQTIKEDRALFNGAQKRCFFQIIETLYFSIVLSLIISVCEAFAYIYSGMYGELDKLGAGNGILLLLQLTFAGVVCILLDEMLQKGMG